MNIAVVIVNYNGLADTLECIESVKKSSISTQIFVVDNASKNDEIKTIEKCFPEVKTIRSDHNLGFAGGNNIAIRSALENGFDYVMLLNNDTIIDVNMVAKMLDVVNHNTVVLPNMYYFTSPKELWFGGGVIRKVRGKVSHLQRTDSVPYEINFATGCCFLAHRSIFEKVGYLCEDYFMYCEDVDFSIRLIQAGVKIKVQPNAKLWHKVAKSSAQDGSAFRIYYNTRNRLLVARKFRSFFSIMTIPYIKCIAIYKMIVAKLRKKDDVYIAIKKALYDFKEIVDV